MDKRTQHIIDAVCAEFRVTTSAVLSGNRGRVVTQARHAGMLMIWLFEARSHSEIGVVFDRSTATVTKALQHVRDEMNLYPPFRRQVLRLVATLAETV